MRAGPAVLFAGGVSYSLGAAATKPFTLPADVLTGVAVGAMAIVVLWRWPLRSLGASARRPGPSAHSGRPAPPTSAHTYVPWLVLVVAFTAWELYNYGAHGSRAAHPTFSSITEAIDRTYALKALLFLGWLASGYVIVRRAPARGTRP